MNEDRVLTFQRNSFHVSQLSRKEVRVGIEKMPKVSLL